MKMQAPSTLGQRRLAGLAALAGLLLCSMFTRGVRADTVLLSDTTLVLGGGSAQFTFNSPGPGTVSAALTNLAWPAPLSSVSFMAATPTQVLSAWSTTTSQSESFSVPGSGTYFADVMATAGGPMNLGVYSLELTYSPSTSPVPLPASRWLLLAALATMIGWLRTLRGLSPPNGTPTPGTLPSEQKK